MSLINDALRKVQTDSDVGRVKPVPLGLGSVHSRPKQKSSFLAILTVVLILGIVGWGIALFIASPSSKEEVVSSTTVAAAAVETESTGMKTAAEVMVEEISNPSERQAVDPVVQQESNYTEVLAQTSVGEVPLVAETAAENHLKATTPPDAAAPVAENTPSKPKVAPAEVASVSEPEPELKLSDEIIFTLKQLDITAVMGDGKNARIMMDGQIHKTGELINLEMKIRFYGKKGTVLFFTDEHGQLYEKNL